MAADDAEAVAVGGGGGNCDRNLRRAVLAALAAALQLLRLELQAAQKGSCLSFEPSSSGLHSWRTECQETAKH